MSKYTLPFCNLQNLMLFSVTATRKINEKEKMKTKIKTQCMLSLSLKFLRMGQGRNSIRKKGDMFLIIGKHLYSSSLNNAGVKGADQLCK